jgi:uridine kinase
MRVFIDLTYHETKINQIIRMKEALSDFRLNILEHEHQAVRSLKPLADLVVDKSYQVVTMEEHQKKEE